MSIHRKAVAWAADYVYAGWRQFRGLITRSKPSDFREGSLTPVLVIPGVYERWHFMLPIIRELHELGHPVHVVETLGGNRFPVAEGSQIVRTYLLEHDLQDLVIVAHSKGGLIGKHVMGFGDSCHRVRFMIAIATPFNGSRYAQLFPGSTIRSLRPQDETLIGLSNLPEVNAHIISVFPVFDPHIPERSELTGAQNIQINSSGHFRVLCNREVRATVMRLLTAENE